MADGLKVNKNKIAQHGLLVLEVQNISFISKKIKFERVMGELWRSGGVS